VEDGSWRYSHPVALADDPSSSTFSSCLALLHCVQASMLIVPLRTAGSAAAAAASEIAEGQQQQQEQPVLPARAFLQIIAVANTWLQDQPPAAAINSSSSAEPVPADHLLVLPLNDVALAAACMLDIESSAAALKHITRACEALSDGFFDLSVLQNAAAAAGAATTSGRTLDAADSSAALVADSVSGFKLLLEAVALLQRNGQCTWLVLPLQQLAASARGCSRDEMLQLVITRGKLLLQVLSDYLMHTPDGPKQQQQPKQQQHQDEQQQQGFEQQQEDAGTENAERCVLVAHVLIQMCPGRLAGAAGLLGSHGIVGEYQLME
jgi:hypothetical protein